MYVHVLSSCMYITYTVAYIYVRTCMCPQIAGQSVSPDGSEDRVSSPSQCKCLVEMNQLCSVSSQM